jgi:hypothetical protein
MQSWWTRSLLILAIVLLSGNLVAFVVGGESLASEEVLYWVLVGIGGLAGVVINGLGIRLTTKCLAKRERTSYLWARRGFLLGLLMTLIVAADVLIGKALLVVDPMKAGIMLIMLAAAPFLFLLSAYRDYTRVVTSSRTGTGSHRRSRSKSKSESSPSADSASTS